MRKQVILCLKVAWVVAALTILLVGTNVCTLTDVACSAAENSMLLFMVLLTFPTGIIFFPISLAFVDSYGGHFPSDFIIGWTVLAIGGFVQWFYFMPRLLEKPRLTFLNLSSGSKPLPIPTPENAISTIAILKEPTPVVSAPITVRTRKQQNQIRSFDKLGRSPLERALHR